ncbi:MAG: tetratricopeptide repeat protein [Polyangiales bacterium]
MARRRSNRLPPHEPSIVVDPRVYHDVVVTIVPAPMHVDDDDDDAHAHAPHDPPHGSALGAVLRAALLVMLSACASFVGVRFLRTHLAGTAHAALVETPRAPASAPVEVARVPASPAPLVTPMQPTPVAPEGPAWMAKVQQARAKLAAGRLDEAEAMFRDVLSRRAEVPAALLGLARVRLARGDCTEASMLAARVLLHMPKNRGASDVLTACLRVDAGAPRDTWPRKVAVARDAALPANPF